MDSRHLTDAIVRQTTLLIAQLATSGGVRAPLAHIADEIFLELAGEIESQGVSRNVVADMFGLALRTYQKKVNRVRESVTQKEETLWESILGFVRHQGGATRKQVLAKFSRDDERHVVAVLGDLVASGLLYGTGRGKHAAYGPVPERELRALAEEQGAEATAHMLWLEIAERPNITRVALGERFGNRGGVVDDALSSLLSDGRIQSSSGGGEVRYRTARVFIPADSEAGWEAAVSDHFRAVCTAIASKLRLGGQKNDTIGGSTLRFEVGSGHPNEAEVLGLLSRFRGQAFELWARVAAYNQEHPTPLDERRQVVVYFGQNVIDPTSDE
jgi:hypothetical protein